MQNPPARHRVLLVRVLIAAAVLSASIALAQHHQAPPERSPSNPGSTQLSMSLPPNDQHNARRALRASGHSSGAGDGAVGLAGQDVKFIKEALASGRTEVATARLAQERASSEEVKAFARALASDYAQINSRLESLQPGDARQRPGTGRAGRNATAPGQPGTPGPLGEVPADGGRGALTRELRALSRTPDSEFDQAFLNLQLRYHTRSIQAFEAVINNAGDAALGSNAAAELAREALPVLRRHTERAQALSQRVASR